MDIGHGEVSVIKKGRGLERSFLDATRSLQFKATVLVVVLTLSVTAMVSGYLMRSSEQLAREQHNTQMVQMAAMLARAAAGSLDRPATPHPETIKVLRSLASDASNGEPLLYVIFTDVDGRPLAVGERHSVHVLRHLNHDSNEHPPLPGQPVARGGTDGVPRFLDVMYPITSQADEDADDDAGETGRGSSGHKRNLLGYVRTGMIADGWHRTMSSRLDLVIGVGVLAMVAAIPLGFLLIRRIVSPLEELARIIHRFSQGDLDVRSPIRRRDEIGRLALSFNWMADQHQQTHQRIVRLNAELEQRVVERTRQLHELASREPLTGLYNRRSFNELLEQRFSEARRYINELSCIMIDLDGFKSVNDAFGHQVGDDVLVLMANTARSQLRTADVTARFGGDEFIVLLPQTDTDRTLVLAERIAEQFQQDVARSLPHVHVTMSMGIASFPSSEIDSAESMIRVADHAMYEAKASGKNRIVVATSSVRPAAIGR